MRGFIGRPEAPALFHRDDGVKTLAAAGKPLAARLMETGGSVRRALASWLVALKANQTGNVAFPRQLHPKSKVLACMHALNRPDRRCHQPEFKRGP